MVITAGATLLTTSAYDVTGITAGFAAGAVLEPLFVPGPAGEEASRKVSPLSRAHDETNKTTKTKLVLIPITLPLLKKVVLYVCISSPI